MYFTQLDESAVMFLYLISLLKTVDSLIIHSKVFVTKTFVEMDFPIILIQFKTLIIHIYRCFMPSE